MPIDGSLPYRRSHRLSGYDYSTPGYYFLTIRIHDPAIVLSHISASVVTPSPAGQMVEDEWLKLRVRFPDLELDEYVVMPDHFHGIVLLRERDALRSGKWDDQAKLSGQRQALPLRRRLALPAVIQAFKSATTNAYIKGVKTMGWQPFDTRLWQRNYYERIVRDIHELAAIGEYIRTNPQRFDGNSV